MKLKFIEEMLHTARENFDIVAAKAKHGVIGTPVGDSHVALSGTSMATPHVAGAAAILAAKNPAWSPLEIKTALMNSAKPHADTGVFDQGAGRVDVARAVATDPVATPAETMEALGHVNDLTEGTRLPRVPEAELEAILHRDSLTLLGLV